MGLSPSARVFLNKLRWLIYEKITSIYDEVLFMIRIPCRMNKGSGDKKVIVYIGEFLPPRVARLAKWTKKIGDYSTLLICHQHGFHEKFSNDGIDSTILFRNEWHLKRIISAIPKPFAFHGFAPKSKYPYMAMVILNKKHPDTIRVMDYQDVLTIYYDNFPVLGWLKKELPFEKKAFILADGIVAHSLEVREAMKALHIKKQGKRLFFPLYSDNDFFQTHSKLPIIEELHLVYAGGVFGSHRDKRFYGNTQFFWLMEYLEIQKIHFHIYSSPSVIKADYEEYEEIAKKSSYFHYHEPVSQSKLPEELSKYHYGLMPFFSETSSHSDLKYKLATTLKLFNYVEAGIPILVGADVGYQSWLVNRYSLGKTVFKKEDFKDVRKLIGDIPYEEQVKKLLENREKLSLKKHIPRLLEFYKTLHEAKS